MEAINQPLPSLPHSVTAYDGQQVDTSQTRWRIRGTAGGRQVWVIDWTLTEAVHIAGRPLFSQRAISLLKLYFAARLRKRKGGTVARDYTAFTSFVRWLAERPQLVENLCESKQFEWSDMDVGIVLAYRDWCYANMQSKGLYASNLRLLYRWGTIHRYPDFDQQTLRELETLRFDSNIEGQNVRYRHQTKGPFSKEEIWQIVQALKLKQGEDRHQAVVMLHLELGINPLAAVRLRNMDLKRFETSGNLFYQLDVPRVKKRTPHRETKRRPISVQLGRLLERLQQGDPEDYLFHWLPNDNPSDVIRRYMKLFARDASIVSPRTGQPLQITPRRFRYTLATHLAAEGASRFHIAELLDHSSLQYVAVYVETSPAITEQVADATDAAMKPVIRRFLGKIVESKSIESSVSPHQQIVPAATPHLLGAKLNIGGIGVCGRNVVNEGLCASFPPMSCYLCPSFAAVRSGPHRELLASIEMFIEANQATADKRILMQLDDVRLAVQEVLNQIERATDSITAEDR